MWNYEKKKKIENKNKKWNCRIEREEKERELAGRRNGKMEERFEGWKTPQFGVGMAKKHS